MFIRSLGLRLGRPYTEYEVYLGKQQRIQSQVQHDRTIMMIFQKLYVGYG